MRILHAEFRAALDRQRMHGDIFRLQRQHIRKRAKELPPPLARQPHDEIHIDGRKPKGFG